MVVSHIVGLSMVAASAGFGGGSLLGYRLGIAWVIVSGQHLKGGTLQNS